MKIIRIDRTQAKHEPSRANHFDGEVKFQVLVSPADGHELDIMNVCFSAGARTKPHRHDQDQVLQILEGEGLVATETEKRAVSAGDVIVIPKGMWHWHGATRDSAMCHLSIKGRGQTDWAVEEKDWAAGFVD